MDPKSFANVRYGSPYEGDSECEDPFDTRLFYELMQAYRWSRLNNETIDAFEAVKDFCKTQLKVAS